MNNSTSPSAETLSALVDGHLPEASAEVLSELLSAPQTLQTWHMYHLVGDVLRSEELAASSADLAFWARLEQQLAQEPVRSLAVPVAVEILPMVPRSAANAARWKWLAGGACMALAGVLVSGLWNQSHTDRAAQFSAAPEAAGSLPQVAVLAPDGQAMIRDPQLDALMAAHQQLGGHSALQMPSGFLRNATFERPAQ